MDSAYDNAIKRRQKLLAELQEIDTFLELYKIFAGTEPEQPEKAAHSHTPPVRHRERPQTKSSGNGAAPTKARTDLPMEELAPIIRSAILDRGRPLTRGQLVQAMGERKITIGGVKPARNMGTIMWRLRDQFTNFEGHGYWPVDRAYSPTGYVPPTTGSKE